MNLGRAEWRRTPQPCLLAEMSPEQGLVSGGAQLLLSPLQPFHQGRYTCLAQGAETRKDFVVLVRGRASPRLPAPCGASELSLPPPAPPQPPSVHAVPPRISSAGDPSEHSVLEGSGVRLECRAEGQPAPHISWLKDGRPLGLQPPSHAR